MIFFMNKKGKIYWDNIRPKSNSYSRNDGFASYINYVLAYNGLFSFERYPYKRKSSPLFFEKHSYTKFDSGYNMKHSTFVKYNNMVVENYQLYKKKGGSRLYQPPVVNDMF